MKLEPVYLVAPKPKPATTTSRRAFLGMSLAFVCGGAIGSACGYSVGKVQVADANHVRDAAELQPSGDAFLDELRYLAVKAPVTDLLLNAGRYLKGISTDYRSDSIAWQGVDRLGRHVIAHADLPNRRLLAMSTIAVIRGATTGLGAPLLDLAKELESIQ